MKYSSHSDSAKSSITIQSLDTSRNRLLAHRSCLHKTLANTTSSALPAATATACAQAARKRHIKAAASLDHATLRANSARNALAKLLHSTLAHQLSRTCTSSDQLAAQLVSKSAQGVQDSLSHAAQLTSASPPSLSLSTTDTHEITRLFTSISDLTSSLVATRAESIKLHAFRDALLSSPPPTSSSPASSIPQLLSETQHLASTLATTQIVSLPLTRHLTQSRHAHASRVSAALTSARSAVVKHAAILRVLAHVRDAVNAQSQHEAQRIKWVRDQVIGECVKRATPAATNKSAPVDIAGLVDRVTSQFSVPAADTFADRANLVGTSQAVQSIIHDLLASSPLPAPTSATDDEVAELVSEKVTELTLSVPRAAELVAGVVDHAPQVDEDWVRWLMGEVYKVGAAAAAAAGVAGAAAGGGGGAKGNAAVVGRRMLDEYL